MIPISCVTLENFTIFVKTSRNIFGNVSCNPDLTEFFTMNGLDDKDVAILKALQENADVTNKELAAKVHLSPTPVFERVKRLREQGYIKKVAAVLDTDKLDCSFVAFCFIKLKQHTFENAKALMDAVQDLGEVGECYNISGDYDFGLTVSLSWGR